MSLRVDPNIQTFFISPQPWSNGYGSRWGAFKNVVDPFNNKGAPNTRGAYYPYEFTKDANRQCKKNSQAMGGRIPYTVRG